MPWINGIGPAENGAVSVAVPCPPICVDHVTITVPELSAAIPRTVSVAAVVVDVVLAGNVIASEGASVSGSGGLGAVAPEGGEGDPGTVTGGEGSPGSVPAGGEGCTGSSGGSGSVSPGGSGAVAGGEGDSGVPAGGVCGGAGIGSSGGSGAVAGGDPSPGSGTPGGSGVSPS